VAAFPRGSFARYRAADRRSRHPAFPAFATHDRLLELNAERDQGATDPVQVLELVELTALQPLVALDLLLELKVERSQRVERPTKLVAGEPRLLQPRLVLGERSRSSFCRRTASWYSVSLRIMTSLRS
jgi:hypothetical protein